MLRRQMIVGLTAAAGLAVSNKGWTMETGKMQAAVRDLLQRYADAWNASDMDAMAALYASDVHWVNIVGMHWQGREQVVHAHRVLFDLMFKGVPLVIEEVESLSPLAGGGVIGVVRWKMGAFTTPLGEKVPPSRDRMTLVLVPQGEGLVIAHGANVQINEAAQKTDPTKGRPG